jgi:preprotein translocase subunit SecY
VLSSLTNIFRVTELRNKVFFTVAILALYRLGAQVPVPGIDFSAVIQLEDAASEAGVLGFLNFFSGGALTAFAVFALGIMPYITASIIMQILAVAIPKLEEWQDQGAVGQRKMTQATRYLTLAIAFLQATGVAFIFGRGTGQGALFSGRTPNIIVIPDFTFFRVAMVVMTMTAGTALLMWMGELISQRGVGNGMSLIIFASVVSRLPFSGAALRAEKGNVFLAMLIMVAIGLMVAIIFIENGQRRIPVQFAKRVVGRRMYGGQSTYIPLKVNQSGVIPVIFASSVLYLPVLLSNIISVDWFVSFVNDELTNPTSPAYLIFLGLMIVGFAYFYTAIQFDPAKQADTIRKQGGFIPGIRPGPQTERYLGKILSRITLPGALFIAGVALVPTILLRLFGGFNENNTSAALAAFAFGGISLLIAVGVALETMKQVDSQLMMRNYEGFLK